MNHPSFCVSKKSYIIFLTSTMIIMIIIPFSLYKIGYEKGSDSVYFTSSSISPSIDGIISEDEWNKADFIISQYTDTNNIKGDSDDYNYMYIGENDTSLFISLDLCTNLKNNYDTDWIGVLINTNPEEKTTNQEEWIKSNFTEGLFYNLNSNSTFGNKNQYIWDIDGYKEEYNIPFPSKYLTIKHGILADMNEYKYYDFTSNWESGIENYEDGLATMIYTEKIPYSEITKFSLNIRFFEEILSRLLNVELENGTASYMEFNVSVNIYDLFPHVPKGFLNYIADDLNFNIDFGIIPMQTYDYNQKSNLTYDERVSSMKQIYDAPGLSCNAIIQNSSFTFTSNNVFINKTNSSSLLFPLINIDDYLIGHNDLLEDGVLLKTLSEKNYTILGGLSGYNNVKIDLKRTLKENNGWINFTIYGLYTLEDLFANTNLNLGFAFDYFNIHLKTSDSLNVNPAEINTIKNESIKSGFGVSKNLNKDHRMIEIAIPKSELNGFNEENFKIMIIGYAGDRIVNSTILGYDIKSPAVNMNYWFTAINSKNNSSNYFDSRNYYIVFINQEKKRTEDV